MAVRANDGAARGREFARAARIRQLPPRLGESRTPHTNDEPGPTGTRRGGERCSEPVGRNCRNDNLQAAGDEQWRSQTQHAREYAADECAQGERAPDQRAE